MLWLKIILKPVSIIAIIFSITIVLAGIGIAAMSGTVETLPVETFPVTPAQQMNVESEETFLVDSYIQKESEETSTPLQRYIALQQEKAAAKVAEHTTADESLYYGVANPNSLFIDKTKNELEEKMQVTYGLVPKGVDIMWMGDSIFFDPKVHDNCSELLPTFDLLGVDKFRIMYAADGVALNCLVKTSEELEARAEYIAQQLESKLLAVELWKAGLLEAERLEAERLERKLSAELLGLEIARSNSPSLSDCVGEKPNLYYKHISEKEAELERRLVQDPYTGECRYVIVIQNPICEDPANKDRSACR
jgi:hypothetical protein